MQQAGCEGGGGAGGAPFSDGMKTPSGKRQARLKEMAASGRRGGARSSGDGRWGEDGGFGGAARSLAAADGAGRGGWEFFLSDGWRSPPKGRGTGRRGRAVALCATRRALSHSEIESTTRLRNGSEGGRGEKERSECRMEVERNSQTVWKVHACAPEMQESSTDHQI